MSTTPTADMITALDGDCSHNKEAVRRQFRKITVYPLTEANVVQLTLWSIVLKLVGVILYLKNIYYQKVKFVRAQFFVVLVIFGRTPRRTP